MSHSSWVPRSVTSSSAARCGASLLLGALALLPASGCEDSSTGGGQPNTGDEFTWPVAKSDFASKLAEAHCGSIAGCCRSGGFAFEEEACLGSARAQFSAWVDEETSKPNRSFDEAAAGRCIAGWRAMNTACDDRALAEAANDACGGVIPGVLALGAACTSSSECAAGPGEEVDCDEGKCALSDSPSSLPRGAEGAACIGSCEGEPGHGYSCTHRPDVQGALCWSSDGVYCSGETDQCEPLAAVGQACSLGSSSGVCVIGARCQDGVCVATANGDACSGSSDNTCPAGSTCDSASKTCQPRKANGEACNEDYACASLECRNSRCVDYTVASGPTCAGVPNG